MPQTPIVSRLASHPRLGRVVRTFGRTLPVKLAAMREALDGQRYDELAELAHWLKGAGGTVGFDDFFDPAREFEIHAKAGLRAELEAGLQQLQAMAARVVIPEEVGASAAATPVAAMPV
jgi:HPt (histidine-containing phosphotransfer) domain-containing protein